MSYYYILLNSPSITGDETNRYRNDGVISDKHNYIITNSEPTNCHGRLSCCNNTHNGHNNIWSPIYSNITIAKLTVSQDCFILILLTVFIPTHKHCPSLVLLTLICFSHTPNTLHTNPLILNACMCA